jgi:small subunit ribosomal protein S6
MKQKYESVVIFDGSLPDDVLVQEQEKVEQFLKANAEHEKTDVWGKKTLAYEINKKKSGYYCLFLFNGEGDVSDKLNKSFRLNQKILRHMTVLFEAAPVVSPEILRAPVQPVDSEEGDE